MFELVPLQEIDAAAVERLLDDAFGNDRRNRTAYRLRDGVLPILALSYAATEGERLVGTVQCWPVLLTLPTRETSLTLVGPVAVAPTRQRGGVGRALMEACIAAAATHGHDALVMIGDPEYYGRFFDFSADATGGWTVPGPVERRRLLARITRPGGLPAQGALGPDRRFATIGATA